MTHATFTNDVTVALNGLKGDKGYSDKLIAAKVRGLAVRGRKLDVDTQAALTAALDRALTYDDANSVCLVLNAMPPSAKTKRALAWVNLWELAKVRYCKKQGKHVAKMVKADERGTVAPDAASLTYWEFDAPSSAPVAYDDKRATKALQGVIDKALAEGSQVSDDVLAIVEELKLKLLTLDDSAAQAAKF
jgi:hypothetical protein